MSCSGCREVVVKVLDREGVLQVTLPGLMANGGSLSLETALQPAPGEIIRIESPRDKKAWTVKCFSFISPTGRNKKRFKYNIDLIPIRVM
jgi:hypothetical protein